MIVFVFATMFIYTPLYENGVIIEKIELNIFPITLFFFCIICQSIHPDFFSGNSLDVKYRRRKVKRKKSSLKVCQGLKAELDTVSPKITRNSRFKSRIGLTLFLLY